MLREHYPVNKLFEEVLGYVPETGPVLKKVDGYLEVEKLYGPIKKDLSTNYHFRPISHSLSYIPKIPEPLSCFIARSILQRRPSTYGSPGAKCQVCVGRLAIPVNSCGDAQVRALCSHMGMILLRGNIAIIAPQHLSVWAGVTHL